MELKIDINTDEMHILIDKLNQQIEIIDNEIKKLDNEIAVQINDSWSGQSSIDYINSLKFSINSLKIYQKKIYDIRENLSKVAKKYEETEEMVLEKIGNLSW